MGIPTLISTATASGASSVAITSGIDSTYDEYMFVITDYNPVDNTTELTFQANVAGESGYNETITSTTFSATHTESGTSALSYLTGNDQAQGTGLQYIAPNVGSGSDESAAGILHLFSPSSTTYVKHWYSRFQVYDGSDISTDNFHAGYFNVTGAIDEIQFKPTSGNFDGVFQMYGIA